MKFNCLSKPTLIKRQSNRKQGRLTKLEPGQQVELKIISTGHTQAIARTRVGINLGVLFLKRRALVITKGCKNEIARPQRLVPKSAKSVGQVALEIGKA